MANGFAPILPSLAAIPSGSYPSINGADLYGDAPSPVGPNIESQLKATYGNLLAPAVPVGPSMNFLPASSSMMGIKQFVASALKVAPPRPTLVPGGSVARAAGGSAGVSAGGSGAYPGAVSPGIAKTALKFLGTPYVWGGTTPSGFDCSGLLQYAAAQNGIHISRMTYDQWKQGRPVSFGQLKPGDAVFFRGGDSIGGLPGHVGVYIGHGMMVDAPHTGSQVRVESVANFGGYMGARRYGRG